MKVPTFRSVQLEDRATNQFQENAKLVLDAVAKSELLDSVFVTVKFIGSADVYVQHGLGRPARGYFVTKSNSVCVPYTSPYDSNSNTTLVLRSSGSADATLLIF